MTTFCRSSLQNRIVEEAEHLNEVLEKNAGKPFNPDDNLQSASSNIISTLCFGKRFDYEDPQFMTQLRRMREFGELLSQSGPLQGYPILRYVPGPTARMWSRFVEIFSATKPFFMGLIAQVKQEHSGKPDTDITSYVDAFTVHQKEVGADLESTVFRGKSHHRFTKSTFNQVLSSGRWRFTCKYPSTVWCRKWNNIYDIVVGVVVHDASSGRTGQNTRRNRRKGWPGEVNYHRRQRQVHTLTVSIPTSRFSRPPGRCEKSECFA